MLTANKVRFILLTPVLVAVLILSGCLDRTSKKRKQSKTTKTEICYPTEKV